VIGDAVLAALLAGLVGVCALTDLRHGKIFNAVTLPAVLLGLILNAALHGWAGLGQAAGGVGLALLLWLVTGAVGGLLGGGDIKLLAAVGALGGATFLVAALVVTVLAGGAMAVGLSLWRGKLRHALGNIVGWAMARLGLHPPVEGGIQTCGLTLPYALPIAAGVLICLLNGYWGAM
jgi:prepilin peptidase CpaA